MALSISRVEYFYCNVRDRPGEAHRLLNALAASSVNLLAFNAIPMGLDQTQLVLFPDDAGNLARVAEGEGLLLDGPQFAFLIRGDDELGALAEIHRKLFDQGVNVSAACGITDGKGGFGYLVYIAADDVSGAAAALGI